MKYIPMVLGVIALGFLIWFAGIEDGPAIGPSEVVQSLKEYKPPCGEFVAEYNGKVRHGQEVTEAERKRFDECLAAQDPSLQ